MFDLPSLEEIADMEPGILLQGGGWLWQKRREPRRDFGDYGCWKREDREGLYDDAALRALCYRTGINVLGVFKI